MRGFLLGVAATLIAFGAAWAYVWYLEPQRLPAEWRRDNPNSSDYAPLVYRWKDDQGVVQLTDQPPEGRPYESVRIDPKRNVVPLMPATESEP